MGLGLSRKSKSIQFESQKFHSEAVPRKNFTSNITRDYYSPSKLTRCIKPPPDMSYMSCDWLMVSLSLFLSFFLSFVQRRFSYSAVFPTPLHSLAFDSKSQVVFIRRSRLKNRSRPSHLCSSLLLKGDASKIAKLAYNSIEIVAGL